MKAIHDPANALGEGLIAIRAQYQVPEGYPPAVLAAADAAAGRAPTDHADRTGLPFITLDPEGATDLDQAFALEKAGADWLLHYAIADVDWFVRDGDAVDTEAWSRGTTLYLPDGKAGLHPPVLAEGAASLLPEGPRPAILFTTRIAPDGEATLDGVERAIIKSRAKLAYETVGDTDLPDGLGEIARRVMGAEDRRGAGRAEPAEQEVHCMDDGHYALVFREKRKVEDENACLSLATNLAIAKSLMAHGTGLFRVMPPPGPPAIARLRETAKAFGLGWPESLPLPDYVRTLDANDARQSAFLLAIRRAGERAGYAPYDPDVAPYHAAIAAPYVHGTAPLRRLGDRFVNRAMLAIARGEAVPETVMRAFQTLPSAMARADATAGRIDRAVIDLAEAVMLDGQEGQDFAAVVTDVDEKGVRIQLCDLPIVARVPTTGLAPGDRLPVRLTEADPVRRSLRFEATSRSST